MTTYVSQISCVKIDAHVLHVSLNIQTSAKPLGRSNPILAGTGFVVLIASD